MGSVFGPVRFLLPVCRLSWFLYTLNIQRICTFFVTFFSATIDGRNLIFGHKLHIGTPYRRKRFLTRQIPTSCLPKSGGIIKRKSTQTYHTYTVLGSKGLKMWYMIFMDTMKKVTFAMYLVHFLDFYYPNYE